MARKNKKKETLIEKLGSSKDYILTDEHKKCLSVLEDTNKNVFITGKAGTGKSTLIRQFRNNSRKNVVVLAPTGIAALNVRGQTIHSFFGFPPKIIEPRAIKKVWRSRIMAQIDVIVIDEISMVRADLLDGVDRFMRLNGRNEHLPFGGVQMVFVGDLYQLPPVLTYEEQMDYEQLYEIPYFFGANSFKLEDFNVIELTTIFRQNEKKFIDFLNLVRTGEPGEAIFTAINEKIVDEPSDDHIVLCTVNEIANKINQRKLALIDGQEYTYQAIVIGNFPVDRKNMPVELELTLKKGSRVLFIQNDLKKRWVNGTLGWVEALNSDMIRVKIDENEDIVNVDIGKWDNIIYEYDENGGGLNEKIIGTLKQYPLRLAWAITVHRSQGMSLDKVCLDFTRSPFSHGQTYVALSRCRTIGGLALTRKMTSRDVIIDPRIVDFYRRLTQNHNDQFTITNNQ